MLNYGPATTDNRHDCVRCGHEHQPRERVNVCTEETCGVRTVMYTDLKCHKHTSHLTEHDVRTLQGRVK